MSSGKQNILDMRYGRQGGRIVPFEQPHIDVPRGWTDGWCWAAGCWGRCAWPPNTVEAEISCTATFPHRGVVRPALPATKGPE